MGHTTALLEALRERHKADATVLAAARTRRDAVLSVGKSSLGWLREFTSGSIAHETVNDPVVDADCGIVLDRRSYPMLGPDGAGVGPTGIVHGVAEAAAIALRATYPDVTIRITKRAIEVSFHEPIAVPGSPVPRQDPSVDLIVALTRGAGARGLWIPNTDTDTWDPSHPEYHTELFHDGDHELRRTRRRAIRLSKLYQRQFGEPLVITSFNQEAIGHEIVSDGMDIGTAFCAICNRGAEQLAVTLTPDPANVSPPLKCPDRYTASQRYRTAADHIARALAHDDDRDFVAGEIAAMFAYLEPAAADTKSSLAATLRAAAPVSFTGAALAARPVARAVPLKPVHAYGEQRP